MRASASNVIAPSRAWTNRSRILSRLFADQAQTAGWTRSLSRVLCMKRVSSSSGSRPRSVLATSRVAGVPPETRRLLALNGLPAYPGGKRRLLPVIFSLAQEALPRARWNCATFADAFLGAGNVSLFAKVLGWGEVIANDIAVRSAIV